MIRSETTAALPDTAETTSPLPTVAATSGRLPRRSETTLPAGMIPKFPPRTYAAFAGEGVLATTASAGGRAQFSGVGSLTVTGVAHVSTTAAFSGSGSLAAYVLNQSALAQFSGTGTLAASGRTTVAASFAGSGTLTAKATTVAKAQFSGAGSLTAASRASAAAAFNGSGSLSAVGATAVQMGAYLTSDTSSTGTTYYQVQPLSVLSGYPDTVLSGTGIQLRAGTYTINVRVQRSVARATSLRIFLDTTVIDENTLGSTNTVHTRTLTNVAVAQGQILNVQSLTPSSNFIVGGATATFFTATPV